MSVTWYIWSVNHGTLHAFCMLGFCHRKEGNLLFMRSYPEMHYIISLLIFGCWSHYQTTSQMTDFDS